MAETGGIVVRPDDRRRSGGHRPGLREDRFLFKQKDERVIPNPPELVAQLKEQQERELDPAPGDGGDRRLAAGVWEGREAAAQVPGGTGWWTLLRQMAVFGAEAPDYAQGKAYLDQARLNPGTPPSACWCAWGSFRKMKTWTSTAWKSPLEFSPGGHGPDPAVGRESAAPTLMRPGAGT